MYLYILRELFLLYSIRTAFLRVLVDYLSGDQKFAVYSSGKEAYTEEKLAVYGLPDQYSMEAVVGNDVYLSIDKDLQQAVYQILEQTIAGIRCIKYKELSLIHILYWAASSAVTMKNAVWKTRTSCRVSARKMS